MKNKNQTYPGFKDENTPARSGTGRKLKDDTDPEINKEDLLYNKEEDSYELDVDSRKDGYDHQDSYDTAAKDGGDADSDYDEANPTAVHEYDKDISLENDVEKQGMHIDNGAIVHVDRIDEELSKTTEDERDDLDEEGYPKK